MAQEAGPTKAELADRIDDIEDLLEEALDPEPTREELVSKVKEIQTVASGEDEEGDQEPDHLRIRLGGGLGDVAPEVDGDARRLGRSP